VPKVTNLSDVEKAAAAAVANIPKDAAAAVADASKLGATVKADVAKVETVATTVKTDVVAADNKLVAFITANPKKIAAGVLVAAALLAWHFI
jgi:hypothetical protein